MPKMKIGGVPSRGFVQGRAASRVPNVTGRPTIGGSGGNWKNKKKEEHDRLARKKKSEHRKV
jgi:hypothetical protein